MGKSKSAAQAATAAPAKVLNGVKGGKVSKPTKGKDISKSLKQELAKKIVKAPTPSASEASSSSESESESDDESDASESEAEVKPKAVAQKPKANGVNGVKKAAKDDSSSEEDSDSDSDDSDDAAPAVKANGVKVPATASGAADDSDSDSDSSDSEDSVADQAARFQPDSDASDSDSSDSASDDEDEAPVVKSNGAAKAAAEADSDDDSEDDSEESSSSEEEEEKPKVDAKKRKADEPAETVSKKTKVAEETADESGASKTLFVGHLSWGVDEDGLYKEFESFGKIESCKIMYHQDSGKSKGFGYVEFTTIADAIAAKGAMHEKMIDGREVNIDFATPRVERPRPSGDDRAKKYGDVESAPSDTIFVGNISFDATYDHIKEAFEQYGTITRISLPTDRESGQPKGFGYVGFSSIEEATEALNALKGADIAGRQVRLDFAQARADDGGQRGGRGGGRGGFDRGGRGGGRGFGGGRGGGRGGFDRGGRGGGRGFGGDRGGRGRGGGSFNRGGFGDFAGKKTSF